jgi:hypothetical protein
MEPEQDSNQTWENSKLYRFEYIDTFMGESTRMVDWSWVPEGELQDYIDSKSKISSGLVTREASEEEAELYDEAYNDGYGIATIMEIQKNDNGISFAMLGINEDGNIITSKKFRCGICDEMRDFETEVAVANDFYVSTSKDDVLWHVCFNCAISKLED